MKTPLCPISGHPMSHWMTLPGDWRLLSESIEVFQIYWCKESGYGALYPALSENRIREAYNVEGYYSHSPSMALSRENESFLDKLRVSLAWRADNGIPFDPSWVAKTFPDKKSLNICDIGCGDGYLIDLLSKIGHTVTGVEIDPKARSIVEEKGLLVFSGTAESIPEVLKNKQFDLVIMSHVLEHVGDPVLSLKNAAALLSEGGTLVVEVPNNACLGLQSSGLAWFHLDVPRHLHFFSEKSLCLASEKANLKLSSIEYANFTRQFHSSWIKAEADIWDRLNSKSASALKNTKRNSSVEAWKLLFKSALAAKNLKYDSVRVLLKKA